MKRLRHLAAFTLIELLVGAGVTSVVGGIIYVVASEGVASFARNASINRAYTDARKTLDQISADINTAGLPPTLVDANGTTVIGATQAQGIRMYHYTTLPTFQIPSGSTADSQLIVNFTPYQKGAGSAQNIIKPGDLATIPLLGHQDTVTSVTNIVTNGDGSGSMTLNFAKAIYLNCTPALPTDSNNNTIQTSFTPQPQNLNTKPPTPATYYTCQIYRQVAYIAVPNPAVGANPSVGAQLRYYPQAMSTGAGSTVNSKACGGLAALNSSTVFNNPANYSVLANIYGGTITAPSGTPTVNALQPFQLLNTTTLMTTICEEGPDYNNRATALYNQVSVANTFCMMRSVAAARCPLLLH